MTKYSSFRKPRYHGPDVCEILCSIRVHCVDVIEMSIPMTSSRLMPKSVSLWRDLS